MEHLKKKQVAVAILLHICNSHLLYILTIAPSEFRYDCYNFKKYCTKCVDKMRIM